MTIDARCLVCRNPDRRRAVELMWNGGMSQAAISRVLVDAKLTTPTITKHLKEHADGDGNARAVVIEPERPAAERVAEVQRLQLDEFERRVALAKARADQLNKAHYDLVDAGVETAGDWVDHDWSEFFDIFHKDNQAAIGSILKAQGLKDKRDMKRDDLKLGLFEAMSRAALAPKSVVGELPSGANDE